MLPFLLPYYFSFPLARFPSRSLSPFFFALPGVLPLRTIEGKSEPAASDFDEFPFFPGHFAFRIAPYRNLPPLFLQIYYASSCIKSPPFKGFRPPALAPFLVPMRVLYRHIGSSACLFDCWTSLLARGTAKYS